MTQISANSKFYKHKTVVASISRNTEFMLPGNFYRLPEELSYSGRVSNG